MADETKITLRPNGPYRVEGNFVIVTADGQEVKRGGPVSLCRCGGSSRKPFCDGTHNTISFQSESAAPQS